MGKASKNIVKINESQFVSLIQNSVKRILKETTDFAQVWGDENYDDMNRVNGVDPSKRRFIEDPSKFAQDLGQKKVAKFNRIHARPAQGRERLVTYKQDPSIAGTGEDNIETTNDFEGGMVANNVNTPWQKYGIDQKTFDKKYEIDPENPSQYRPKGGPMLASKVHDDVAFPNPWGQGHMNVDKGGYMMQDPKNKRDTYGIQDTDFNGTYNEINENRIKKIVSETLRRLIKEYEGDNFDDNDDVVDTDDWRLEEPGEDEVSSILSTVRERCESCGAIFKELGDNEFGVISRNGNSMDVVTLLKGLEKDRIIYNTGGEISENGPWHAKFRIIGALKESASFNNTMDKAEKNFNPHTLRGKIGRRINPAKAKKFDGVQQKAKDMSYYDINDASFLSHNHPDENDAKEIKMKRERSNKYRR